MSEKPNIEEYSALRAEILQLNSQAFTLVSGSLALNFAILALGLGRSSLENLNPFIPLIALTILIASNILIAHKIRMAHRLGFFQKYFIEPTVEGLQWGEVYSAFRNRFKETKDGLVFSIAERFVVAQTAIIIVGQYADIGILAFCRLSPERTWSLSISIIVLFLQLILLRIINNYEHMEKVFQELAQPDKNSHEDTPC